MHRSYFDETGECSLGRHVFATFFITAQQKKVDVLCVISHGERRRGEEQEQVYHHPLSQACHQGRVHKLESDDNTARKQAYWLVWMNSLAYQTNKTHLYYHHHHDAELRRVSSAINEFTWNSSPECVRWLSTTTVWSFAVQRFLFLRCLNWFVVSAFSCRWSVDWFSIIEQTSKSPILTWKEYSINSWSISSFDAFRRRKVEQLFISFSEWDTFPWFDTAQRLLFVSN